MFKRLLFMVTTVFMALVFIPSCGGPKTFQSISFPDVGVTIEVSGDWLMTVKGSDRRAFTHRRQDQPEYALPPITAAKGNPLEEYINPIPNWRFIGVKGEFNHEMNPMTDAYPIPEGLYYVPVMKGELQDEYVRELPWPGAEGVEATVRLYEITHGTPALGTSDLWHAYTVTFNHKGNALEFNFQIPSSANVRDWLEEFWKSIIKLELSD